MKDELRKEIRSLLWRTFLNARLETLKKGERRGMRKQAGELVEGALSAAELGDIRQTLEQIRQTLEEIMNEIADENIKRRIHEEVLLNLNEVIDRLS